MQKLLMAVALCGMAATPAMADTYSYNTLGIGASSCATAFQGEAYYVRSFSWVNGWWTASNFLRTSVAKHPAVGLTTDPNGIIGEVRLYCASHPSVWLENAAIAVYINMLDAGQ